MSKVSSYIPSPFHDYESSGPKLKGTLRWNDHTIRIFKITFTPTDRRQKPYRQYSVTIDNDDPGSGYWDSDFRYSAGIALLTAANWDGDKWLETGAIEQITNQSNHDQTAI